MATNKELEAKVSELKALIAEKDAQIESLSATPEGTSNQDSRVEELEAQIAEKDALLAEKDAMIAQLEKGVKVVEVTKNTVPGTYKSEFHDVTVRFKEGFVKTRTPEGIVDSAVLIKNKGGKYTEYLDHLISIQYGGLEVVK